MIDGAESIGEHGAWKGKQMKKNRRGTQRMRAELAQEVYWTVLRSTESFREGDVGVQLAYLMGAILDDSGRGAVMLTRYPKCEDLLRILLTRYPDPAHPVWKHIVMVDRNCDPVEYFTLRKDEIWE